MRSRWAFEFAWVKNESLAWNRSKTPCPSFGRIACWFECARPDPGQWFRKRLCCPCPQQSHCFVHVVHAVYACSSHIALLFMSALFMSAAVTLSCSYCPCRIEKIHRMHSHQLSLTACSGSIVHIVSSSCHQISTSYSCSDHSLLPFDVRRCVVS